MKRFIWLSMLPLMLAAITVKAETAYVTDQFEITVRSGKGTGHKIVRILPTGSRVEVLEVSAEDGYARIRTADEIEGWVLQRYLKDSPVAQERLTVAEKKIAEMKQTITELRTQLTTFSSDNKSLEKNKNSLNAEKARLEKSLAEIREASANVIAINEENKALKSQLLTLRRDIQAVQQENSALQDNSARDWFMIGAGVLLVGMVFGLVLPNLRMRRKQSWSSL